MPEVIIQTCFDGTEISLLSMEQSLSLYKQGITSVQIKNNIKGKCKVLDYCNNNSDLTLIYNSQVIDNATNIYGINIDSHIIELNPKTYNILFLPNINYPIDKIGQFYDILSKFDEILVADNYIQSVLDDLKIKNTTLIMPDVFLEKSEFDVIKDHKLTILCNFPLNGLETWDVFFEAYLQTSLFEDTELFVISDIFTGSKNIYDIFTNEIKKLKNKYNIKANTYKVKLLLNQTPVNINNCIIKSDIFISPFTDNNGWNLYTAHAAELSKQVVLTAYSGMAKHVHNCDIIMDLPKLKVFNDKKTLSKAINIWKMFLNDLEINKRTSLIRSNIKLTEFCNSHLQIRCQESPNALACG